MKRSGRLPALGALLLIDALLFRPFLSGARVFIGNADRFNHYLPVLFHFARAAEMHQPPGWDGMIFSGWNTLGLPWIFPAGYHHFLAGNDSRRFLFEAGLCSFTLFFLAGVAAHLLLSASVRPRRLAFVGALLYQCAFASTLRITQDDQTFAVLLLSPVCFGPLAGR